MNDLPPTAHRWFYLKAIREQEKSFQELVRLDSILLLNRSWRLCRGIHFLPNIDYPLMYLMQRKYPDADLDKQHSSHLRIFNDSNSGEYMKKHHVALFYSQSLLGEGLQHLLSKMTDINILGPWIIDEFALQHLNTQKPDTVIIANDGLGMHDPLSQNIVRLTTEILERYSELPVVEVLLEKNQVRVYNSHAMPASSTDLNQLIRKLGN